MPKIECSKCGFQGREAGKLCDNCEVHENNFGQSPEQQYLVKLTDRITYKYLITATSEKEAIERAESADSQPFACDAISERQEACIADKEDMDEYRKAKR